MPAQSRRAPAKKKPASRAVAVRSVYRPARSMSYRAYQPRVSGRGAYYVKGGAYGSASLPGIGKVGGDISAGYYRGIDPYVKGLGAYDVRSIKHNVLVKPMIPSVMNSKQREGATIIRHREFLGNITSSSVAGQFKLERYTINPGDSNTFPWLSTIAQNYEEYEMNGLMFQFRSTASDAIASSSNLALGNLMMATQYDSTDPPFLNSTELLNYTWSASSKVSETTTHFVECAPKQSVLNRLYVREFSDSTNPTEDARFSDLGIFSIATEGLQGTNVVIGQLWVSYECLFYKPKMGSISSEAGAMFHYTSELVVGNKYFGGIDTDGLFNSHNNLAIQISNDPANDKSIIQFPPAQALRSYLVVIALRGGPENNLGPIQVVDLINCTACDIWRSGLSNLAIAPTAPVALTLQATQYSAVISTDGLNLTPIMSIRTQAGLIPTASAYCDIFITQIPYIAPESPL